MAQQMAALILAHNLYVASTRALYEDIEKASNSIGYPTGESFIACMADFKLHDEFLFSEIKELTSFLADLTEEAASLTEEFRKRRVAAGGVVQPLKEKLQAEKERVKAEVDRFLKAMMAAVDAHVGRLGQGGSPGSHVGSPPAAPREAQGPAHLSDK
jgi:hypothetical protein